MAVSKDIYKTDIDFKALAVQYPDFAKKLKPNRQLDFSDPESVRQLTRSLLHRDFNITVDLPEDRLCPPVPNRFNYILWLQDLLDTTGDDYRDKYDPRREVIGVDMCALAPLLFLNASSQQCRNPFKHIALNAAANGSSTSGTGASCIYPLLACRQRSTWKFIGTEIDDKSLSYAQRNVKTNGLESRIKVLKSSPDGPLIPTQLLGNIESIDFVMTNPPFYTSEAEMLESAKGKQRPPNSACTGAPVEMICPGGEVAFVKRLIDESAEARVREQVQWFTSMLGKLASVEVVVEALKGKGCGNWAVTEFVQGQKTRRWAVGWSWGDRRPAMAVARGAEGPGVEKKWLPFPSEFGFDVQRGDGGLEEVGEQINCEVEALDLKWQWKKAIAQGLGMAERDVWSRKARRRKGDVTADAMDEDGEAALVFKISLSQNAGDGGVSVNVRWLQGKDSVLFESFCGWLKRKVENR